MSLQAPGFDFPVFQVVWVWQNAIFGQILLRFLDYYIATAHDTFGLMLTNPLSFFGWNYSNCVLVDEGLPLLTLA